MRSDDTGVLVFDVVDRWMEGMQVMYFMSGAEYLGWLEQEGNCRTYAWRS